MATYTSRYNPNRSPDWNYGGAKWRLSRSKIDLFIECPRCFYLDNKLGTARPRGPSFTLNIAVDALFKKEFDTYREQGVAHPLMKENGIDAVPFVHKDIDTWRDNFKGIQHIHEETGLTVSGAIDDVWQTSAGELIVVDYKATAKDGAIESLADSAWEDQYKRQIGVYQWLFEQNGFPVSNTGYFVYANARTDVETFDDTLSFETTVVPCNGDRGWIEKALVAIRECLERDEIPQVGGRCEFCPYREAAGKKLLTLHQKNKQK